MKKWYRFLKGILMVTLLLTCMQKPVIVTQAEQDLSSKCGLAAFEFIEVKDVTDIPVGNMYVLPRGDISYWTSFESDYYYNQLSDGKRYIWDELKSVCIALAVGSEDAPIVETTKGSFTVTPYVTFDSNSMGIESNEELGELVQMFKYSNPQYYFLMDSWVGYLNGSNSFVGIGVYDAFQNGETRMDYTSKFCERVDSWVAQVASERREEDKVKLAHDIIAQNTVYDYAGMGDPYNQSAYSMVCTGKTVCAGYAATLQLLLNPNGILTTEVTSADHAWNNVMVHGQWYAVDVTWDDSDYGVYYTYYMKSDASIGYDNESHVVKKMWYGYVPELKYDSVVGWDYYSPYFEEGNYVYFIVNDNNALAERCVVVVEIKDSGAFDMPPAMIMHGNNNYIVLGVSTGEINSAGIYLVEYGGAQVTAGLVTDVTGTPNLLYQWLIYDYSTGNWIEAQEWTLNNEWFVWYPPHPGDFLIQGRAKVVGTADETAKVSTIGYNNTYSESSEDIDSDEIVIIGECQMPYEGDGGGYLIGVETNRNPNQELRFELLVLDLTLYNEGKDAWIWTSGRQLVGEGNAFWAIWQPEYGYYLTLFCVYDMNGNLLAQECYGFANVY